MGDYIMKFFIPKGTYVRRYRGNWKDIRVNFKDCMEELISDKDVLYDEDDFYSHEDHERASRLRINPNATFFLHFRLPKVCYPWIMLEIFITHVKVIS